MKNIQHNFSRWNLLKFKYELLSLLLTCLINIKKLKYENYLFDNFESNG